MKLSIAGIGAAYDGKLSADGNTMTGTLKGFSVPVQRTMKRVGEDQAWAIPKPPAQPKPLASADPVFEVASVKLTRPDSTIRGGRLQGGTLTMAGLSLMDLMTQAFDLHPQQIIGAPAWSASERYDLLAKAEGEGQPNPEQLKVMLRKLLAEHFHLTSHKDQRELPVYTLSVTKGGAKISKNDRKNETSGIIFRGLGSVLLNNSNMDDLSRMLQSAALNRPVVNQTNLSGRYDFSLVWTPEQALSAIPNPAALSPGDRADVPPDIYSAVQQQVGLKLDAAKMRIEVLVVDKVEKPSEN